MVNHTSDAMQNKSDSPQGVTNGDNLRQWSGYFILGDCVKSTFWFSFSSSPNPFSTLFYPALCPSRFPSTDRSQEDPCSVLPKSLGYRMAPSQACMLGRKRGQPSVHSPIFFLFHNHSDSGLTDYAKGPVPSSISLTFQILIMPLPPCDLSGSGVMTVFAVACPLTLQHLLMFPLTLLLH